MRTAILFLALAWVGGLAAHAEEQTYAERLGWEKGDRVVILHVDDIGMSHASNRGAIEALEDGIATSVSIMMPCPWVPEFAEYLKKHPDTCAGLHLTMTSEWDYYRWGPVAGKPAVPGLVDPMGCLWDGNGLVYDHATPDEAEAEIRAQIDRSLTMGIQPTHLDSHMGTLFYNPEYFERYMKVGIEKQIPILMAKEFDAEAAEKVWKAGLPVLDYIFADTYDWKTTEKSPLYIDYLKNLKPGITEIIMHCTKPNDVIPIITGNRDHLYGDLYAMVDPEVKKVVEEEGIILTNWREIAERRKNAE
ncbi:MAG: polysaccharide deacetylase family protein [Candidatus Omnitrophica bacterium]|nr:polysaccharide deacetylase family protein [Candidatus Omnitrophota bacterium]MCB9784495.1 polysaccharide deacetylase family protein [Candidatus Omnitrophota bacterium]